MTPRHIVLVTGGAGFIGSNIVARLCERGDVDVVVCDRLREDSLGKWRNIAKHPIADFVAPEALFEWLEKWWKEVATVVHMGAISSTTETDVDKIIHANFTLSRDLWRWANERQRRLIYASSAATYGDGSQGFVDADDPQSLAQLRPLNAYGWSKALFDLYAARARLRGRGPQQCVGLKFFNVYGPNEEHKGTMKSVAAQMWPNVRDGHPVHLFQSHREGYADGGQLRDFVYVRDAAEVVNWLLDNQPVNGVFADLAAAVFKGAGRDPQIIYDPMPHTLRDKYQYLTQADLGRLREAGYASPMTSLEDGVADYVAGYLSQPDPYR
jgi:ADP-L-glycero-D-manno-heptose 6-epimerase